MTNITVRVLNYHGLNTHIHLLLEKTDSSSTSYLPLNRWDESVEKWGELENADRPCWASSQYEFNIDADSDKIESAWEQYYNNVPGNLLLENCADATRRFLTEFAYIPSPQASLTHNISFNHLIFGIFWPSFIPSLVTLPGRVMDNTKYHIKKQEEFVSKLQADDDNISVQVAKKRYLLQDFNKYLEELKEHADSSDNEHVSDLINKLDSCASEFEQGNLGYSAFRQQVTDAVRQCQPHIKSDISCRQILLNILLAVAGLGVFYIAAATLNHKHNGSFLFFNQESLQRDVHKVKVSLPEGMGMKNESSAQYRF